MFDFAWLGVFCQSALLGFSGSMGFEWLDRNRPLEAGKSRFLGERTAIPGIRQTVSVMLSMEYLIQLIDLLPPIRTSFDVHSLHPVQIFPHSSLQSAKSLQFHYPELELLQPARKDGYSHRHRIKCAASDGRQNQNT